nr:pyrroloquinoline quinone biosynthesis protein PqqF [Serratia ureilytica]
MTLAASWQLDNGLAVRAISTPDAEAAAALVRIEAGSFQAPAAWPGLAHLLEHMLFRGSVNFSAQDGLMGWTPAVGGRLNATTQATQTAFFFEVGAEQLAEGLARLIDMLAVPQLAAEAIAQEIEVIDAEYRLLRADGETRCEAAQRQMFSGIDALHRFHIGSRAAFGSDIPALQRVLRQFHHHYYRAPNITLWLQGPQSLEQLHALAQRYGGALPPGSVAPPEALPPLAAGQDYTLFLPGAPQLRLVFALPHSRSRGWLRRLERLLLDEAPGGLLTRLRAHAWADAVRLDYARCAENSALLSFIFTVNHGAASEAAHIESALLAWLQALIALTPAQLAHFGQLANRDFHRLAPLDQLRARAFGLPPVEPNDDWPRHISALISAPHRRLAVLPEGGGETREIQGLPLALAPFVRTVPTPTIDPFRFFSTSAALPIPPLPGRPGAAAASAPRRSAAGAAAAPSVAWRSQRRTGLWFAGGIAPWSGRVSPSGGTFKLRAPPGRVVITAGGQRSADLPRSERRESGPGGAAAGRHQRGGEKPAPRAAQSAKRYCHSPPVSPIAGGVERINGNGPTLACHLGRRRRRVKTAAVAFAV